MMNSLTRKICSYLYKSGVIKSEDIEIYEYGFALLLMDSFSLITLFFLGTVFKLLWESIVFIVLFKPLRKYAGGYHANNRVTCYVSTSLVYVIVLLGVRYINKVRVACIVLTVILLFVCLLFLAPLDHPNKPITKYQRLKYKKYIYIITAIELAMLFLAYLFKIQHLLVIILLIFILVSLLLVLGKIFNK